MVISISARHCMPMVERFNEVHVSESYAVRHLITLLCMTKKSKATFDWSLCIWKKLKRQLKEEIAQKFRARLGDEKEGRRMGRWVEQGPKNIDQYLAYNYWQLPGLLGDLIEMRGRESEEEEMDRELRMISKLLCLNRAHSNGGWGGGWSEIEEIKQI